MMIKLEEYLKKEKNENIYVYALMNNGFYEGHQNKIAVNIMENWCDRSGIKFGMAICSGAGEMVGSIENVPMGNGPLKDFGKALESFIECINKKSVGKSVFFSPNFPRFAWKYMAHSFWKESAKKNNLKRKDIIRRI